MIADKLSNLNFIEQMRKRRQLVIVYKQAFVTSQGKEVLLDLMNRFHMLNSHKGEAFAEGQRSVVLHIIREMNIDMDALDKLMKGGSNA